MFDLHPHTCERAREWASLGLDGELSQFESVLLRTHLDECASCSAYAEKVTRATGALREAPFVPLATQIALPTRRRRPAVGLRVYQLAGSTAALAAAVLLGSMLGAPSSRPGTSATVRSGAGSESVAEDALLRGPRLAMINAEKGLGTQRGIGITLDL